MYTHLYSLPSAIDVADEDLEGPVPPIEAVLFDFANTLFRNVPLDDFLTRVWTAAGRDPLGFDPVAIAASVQSAAQLPHVRAAQVERDTSSERHREATRVHFAEVPELADVFDHVYATICDPDAWFPYTDTGPVLRELQARGIPVGIVSDIPWDVSINFAHAGFDGLAQSFALSYQMGVEKPDPRMFLKACADLGADPRRTLMVGDNPPKDGGAVACGLRVLLLPAEPKVGERGLNAVLRLLG